MPRFGSTAKIDGEENQYRDNDRGSYALFKIVSSFIVLSTYLVLRVQLFVENEI